MSERRYRPVAESYLTEWLGITYPPGTWKTNVALGDVKTPEFLRMTPAEARFVKRSFRPIADAVVVLQDEVHLVECKIRDDRGKIEQLLIYEYLFPKTPEYRPHWKKKIRKILLTPKDVGGLAKFLEKYGIEVVQYKPPWILEYLGSLNRKERRMIGYSFEI